jgi:hypothetical protein
METQTNHEPISTDSESENAKLKAQINELSDKLRKAHEKIQERDDQLNEAWRTIYDDHERSCSLLDKFTTLIYKDYDRIGNTRKTRTNK